MVKRVICVGLSYVALPIQIFHYRLLNYSLIIVFVRQESADEIVKKIRVNFSLRVY